MIDRGERDLKQVDKRVTKMVHPVLQGTKNSLEGKFVAPIKNWS